jgi:lysophospholipase L1-like esterase
MLTRRHLLAAVPVLAAHPARARPPLAAVPISRLQEAWWRERHAAKLAEIRRGRVDLVFLGDSITQNYEKSGPPAWQDFRPVWQHFYGDRNAVNLGFSGDATSHLLWRIENGEIAGISPKAAVILIGANNLGRLHWPADDDVAGIQAVVAETRRRLPRTQILLLGILPSERSEWATRTTQEVNAALAKIYGGAAQAGVTFLDVSGVFMHGGTLDRSSFYDPLLTPPEPPLHPTAAAQARMAAAMEPALAKLMGDRNHAVG